MTSQPHERIRPMRAKRLSTVEALLMGGCWVAALILLILGSV